MQQQLHLREVLLLSGTIVIEVIITHPELVGLNGEEERNKHATRPEYLFKQAIDRSENTTGQKIKERNVSQTRRTHFKIK